MIQVQTIMGKEIIFAWTFSFCPIFFSMNIFSSASNQKVSCGTLKAVYACYQPVLGAPLPVLPTPG
jgi:hypothetical protein